LNLFEGMCKKPQNGILTVTETTAIKRVIAFQLAQLMAEQGLTKTEMASRMNTSRASLNRLLDPASSSVNLQTLENAAHALNKRLHIEFA